MSVFPNDCPPKYWLKKIHSADNKTVLYYVEHRPEGLWQGGGGSGEMFICAGELPRTWREGATRTMTLKVWSLNSWELPKNLLGHLWIQNYLNNNTKMVIAFFHCANACSPGSKAMVGSDELGDWDWHVYTDVYKMDD